MHDEFEYARERVEAHPTMAAYLASRSDEQLAALIYDDTYRRNVFGTYPGLSGDHSVAIIGEVRRRARRALTPEATDAAAKYLRETMQAGKRLTPWDTTPKTTKKKWLALAEGALRATQPPMEKTDVEA